MYISVMYIFLSTTVKLCSEGFDFTMFLDCATKSEPLNLNSPKWVKIGRRSEASEGRNQTRWMDGTRADCRYQGRLSLIRSTIVVNWPF
jgi:hypothetical protein